MASNWLGHASSLPRRKPIRPGPPAGSSAAVQPASHLPAADSSSPPQPDLQSHSSPPDEPARTEPADRDRGRPFHDLHLPSAPDHAQSWLPPESSEPSEQQSHPPPRPPADSAHTRTMSSTAYPYPPQGQFVPAAAAAAAAPVVVVDGLHRGPSTASYSTASSIADAQAGQQQSYVAMMRRQKATVWCERPQAFDPGLFPNAPARQASARLSSTPSYASLVSKKGSLSSASGNRLSAYSLRSTDRPTSLFNSVGRTGTIQYGTAAAANGTSNPDPDRITRHTSSSKNSRAESLIGNAAGHSRSASGRSSSSFGSAAQQQSKGRSSLSRYSTAESAFETGPPAEPAHPPPPLPTQPEGARSVSASNYLSPPSSVRSSPAPAQPKGRAAAGTDQPGPARSALVVPEERRQVRHRSSLGIHNPDVDPLAVEIPQTMTILSWPAGGEEPAEFGSPFPYGLDGPVEAEQGAGTPRLFVANPDSD